MSQSYQVIDLFAGPGGLAEGFSAFSGPEGDHPFYVTLSVEKEKAAHQTLQLRAFLRQFDEFPDEYYDCLNAGRPLPDWSVTHSGEWETAQEEALQLTLGETNAALLIDRRVDRLTRLGVETVLIGGPPCQAYSLVGRARNQGNADYVPEEDSRHFLYREYIRILKRLRPAAFVMENVKGMLSSSVAGERIFEQVVKDLQAAGGTPDSYELFALGLDATKRPVLRRTRRHDHFLIRAEDFGVPQARPRVIIIGLRKDKAKNVASSRETTGTKPDLPATVRHVIAGVPRLRSRLTTGDGFEAWRAAVIEEMDRVIEVLGNDPTLASVSNAVTEARTAFVTTNEVLPIVGSGSAPLSDDCPAPLAEWLKDDRLDVVLNHQPRSHMTGDFARYIFCSAFAAIHERSPKAREFPKGLAPDHKSWSSGAFADRFRTQCWDEPATTITSHISKDGHYFIHPDMSQCRTLTVREAARIQTFPDNYLFLGNRTEQYVQVGNAVPPFLAKQIAEVVWRSLQLGSASAPTSGLDRAGREAVCLQE